MVVLRTQEKTRLLSSLTEGGGNGSIFTKLPTQSRLSHPSMGCSGELPVPGGAQAGTNQCWMASWPWWPFKESHPPHTHGCQATLTLLSSDLSPSFRSRSDSWTRPSRPLDSIILCSHLPPIWSGSSTRVGPGRLYSSAFWGPSGKGGHVH